MSFIKKIMDIYIILEWLRQHYLNVGPEIYNTSLPVRELQGEGFFGVNNESFAGPACTRWSTDALGFKQDRIDNIYFRSESCETLLQSEYSKKIHRVEHCNKVKDDLWNTLEETYVIKGKPLDFIEIGKHIVKNAIVCLIKQVEEKPPNELKISYDPNKPFTRYHAPIFYDGNDVSNLTRSEIIIICMQKAKDVLLDLKNTNNTQNIINEQKNKRYPDIPTKHTFCPHDIATRYATNEYELLNRWYNHKRDKILEATSGKWYKPKFKKRYDENKKDMMKINQWDINHFKTLSKLNNDPTKKLIHNRMGRLYWVWSNDRLYEQRFARENGPYQVRNIKFLRHLYPNAQRCVDIGMNIANNTMEYATWVVETIGFEPFVSTFKLAQENIKLNKSIKLQGRYYNSKTLKTEHNPNHADGWWKISKNNFASLNITGNTIIHNIGLGSTAGQFTMLEKPNNAGHNHVLLDSMKNVKYKEYTIQIKTLDSYEFDVVDFIKIDVEGFEFEVLKGANKTINKCRPTVQIEIVESQCKKFGYTPQDIFNYFNAIQYKVFDFNGNELGTTWKKLKGIMDMFFVPSEIIDRVKRKNKTHPGMITGFSKRTKSTYDKLFKDPQ